MLAFLIDCHGASVTRKELAAVLFEDAAYTVKVQDYIKKIIKSLKDTLKNEGVQDILIISRNSYSVDTSKFSCDLYEYEKGLPDAIRRFNGEYMTGYEWGEYKIGAFYK